MADAPLRNVVVERPVQEPILCGSEAEKAARAQLLKVFGDEERYEAAKAITAARYASPPPAAAAKPKFADPTQGVTAATGPQAERTFIAVKPDGVQRGLVGEIIRRFEAKGFKLVGLKLLQPTLQQAQTHYSDLSSKKFFKGLCEYFSCGPIVAMCWEGLEVVKTGRTLLGATRPADSLPGTIRGDLCVDVGRNIIHGSDSLDSAAKEIGFWFKPNELVNWKACGVAWIYE